jgi:glycosyltransferase A (GT-A) superfamily protein (DUF2064 family)
MSRPDTAALVVVLCKPPGAPHCKTRLAAEVGAAGAETIYRRCLRTVAASAAATAEDVRFAVDGQPAAVAHEVGDLTPAADFVRQSPDPFATRQAREIHRAISDGYAKVVLVASDLPWPPSNAFGWVLRTLDDADVAVVPSADGGYSLLGTRCTLAELERVPMSSSSTLDSLMSALEGSGRTVTLAPFRVADIDTAADVPDDLVGGRRA